MKKLLHILLILFCLIKLSSVSGQDESSDTLTIFTYGYPHPVEYINAKLMVGERWKIHFTSVAGCTINRKLRDSVDYLNKKTKIIIGNKYGKDWEQRFKNEVEEELKIQLKVRKLIDEQIYIKKLDSIHAKDGNGLDYLLFKSNKKHIYTAKVYDWGEWKGKTELLTYFKLTIDLRRKIVKLDSDTKELFEFK